MHILHFSTYVFDLDGVIVDSEKIHYKCYKKAFKEVINYDLNWNSYCEIHHSIDNSFKIMFPSDYEKIYSCKNELYKNEISNIELIEGFYNFFRMLVKSGKYICIVSDTSKETFKLICEKFSFLNKCNIVITRESVDKRKPDSSCYLKLINQLKNKVKLYDIIAFEDSYKGWTSVCNTIYNCVLVNSLDYVYYNKINPQNSIVNFENIADFKFKTRFDFLSFYISSKTHHSEKWLELSKYFPIESSWIKVKKNKEQLTQYEKENICNSIQNDIVNSDFGILYLEKYEKNHIGSLIEIGMLLSNFKKIYVCGNNIFLNEVLFNFENNFIFSYVGNFDITNVFYNIQYDINIDYKVFESNILKSCSLLTSNPTENMTEVIDYVVICASGKGTRLLPITEHIPKLLVNIDNANMLGKIIQYWKSYSNKFVIIIDSMYNIMVNFYLNLLNIEYEIINVDCVNGEENSYTINHALSNKKFIDKKILITWCDIFPETIIPKNVFENKNIIFTYKNYGRYDAYDNTIVKKPFGNIIGIYYFYSFKQISNFEPKMDICDCYENNFGKFETFEIDILNDIGDYSKLCEYIKQTKNRYSTRYFNEITDLSGDIIEKKSTCLYGDNIITREMSFYKYHCLDNIPEVVEFGEKFFKMKKVLKSSSFTDVFNNSTVVNQVKLLENVISELDKIHNVECYDVKLYDLSTDIKIEFNHKVLERIENVKPLLSCFSNIKYVNKIKIIYNHHYIIDEIYDYIKQYFNSKNVKYNTIHGDPHFSNILTDNNNKIWFIDPRGYFGNTKLFGIKEYDISKLMYSLSGFDQINNNPNHFFIIDNNKNSIDVNINNNIDLYLRLFEKYDKNILIKMTILHWFGLTDYSKNNIHKCISSYYYGIYLYHYYFT